MRLSAPIEWLRARQRRRALRPLRADMEAFFAELRGTPVLFFANPGNAGDSLIAAATAQAFARSGVEAAPIGLDAAVEGRVVVLGGGGNFIPLYHQIAEAIVHFSARKAARIVLLPHTIRGREAALRALAGNVTIFCRDRPSFEHVRAVRPDIDARLGHDMAFHLDAAAFLADAALAARAAPVWRATLAKHGLDEAALGRREGVRLRRLDAEAPVRAPTSDLDVSHVFTLGTGAREAPIAAWCLLKTIGAARLVETDRLHVAIGAALLGTPCRFHDNSYGKNSAVYRQSLAGRFANIRPVGEAFA